MKKYRSLILTAVFFILSVIGYILFARSMYFSTFLIWSQKNTVLYFCVLFLIKAIGIIYAPIPGGLLTLGSIPFLGWKLAYLADFMGSIVGGSIAYFIGKKYGYKLLKVIFDEATIQKIKKIKLKKNREMEATFVLRVLTGSSIVDALCYAAGLMGVSYRNFLIGSILAHLCTGLPVFYAAGNLLNLKNLFLNGLVLVLAMGVVYKIKGRYFE